MFYFLKLNRSLTDCFECVLLGWLGVVWIVVASMKTTVTDERDVVGIDYETLAQ